MYQALLNKLKKHGQEHVLKFWNRLNDSQQNNLAAQINRTDWELLSSLIKNYVVKRPDSSLPPDLDPPVYYPLRPKNKAQKELYAKAVETGRNLLRESKVAMFTVAGGQGTRLGYDGPKGTYPITPVKNKSLFQYFAESNKRASEKFSSVIPWYIMTSDLNDEATRKFFADNKYFDLEKNNVKFFRQGTMPAMSTDGKVLLDEKDSISLSPDGHGGSLMALRNSGSLEDMKKRGIEYISYFQVDNPLVPVVNPLFIGLHHLDKSEMSSVMLPKTGPFEKLGNFCISHGRLFIIEYSDLPNELAEKRNRDGSLVFIAGSPAIHVISCGFIERLTAGGKIALPWHRADKKVPFIDAGGNKITPADTNAVKLETFIFDALPFANKTIILEVEREKQFAPTKNMTGVDSVESCRKMLVARDAEWLQEAAGIKIPRNPAGEPDCTVELSPLSYFDLDDVRSAKNSLLKKSPGRGEAVYYE